MQYRDECKRTYSGFEYFEIKIKDGKREVYVNGDKVDLSNVICLDVHLDCDGTKLVINSIGCVK